MAKLANPFIPYLNRYTTTSPDHEAAFDEFITQAPPPSGEPLRLETRTEAFLHDLFHRKCPPSVILTGNAGDGKTHLCRRIVKAFTGQPVTDWADRLDRPIEPDKADIGPSVVRFKIRLRPGEKLSHLQAIAADLQRELALTAAPLVDNVLGTRFVGIDLPRPQPETLLLTEALVELPSAEVGHLPFLVGKTPSGETVKADLSTLPHLLVAGSTGSGKTIFLYTLITSLLHQFGPDALSLLLVDPKQTDFVYFEGLPHLPDGQVIIEAEEAIAWLEQLTTETLDERTRQLRQARCRDLLDYNARHRDAPMLPIVVVIDEYADLVQVLDRSGRQAFERRLVRLAQRARNVGIHLVIATQRPSADIVTTSLKTCRPASPSACPPTTIR